MDRINLIEVDFNGSICPRLNCIDKVIMWLINN